MNDDSAKSYVPQRSTPYGYGYGKGPIGYPSAYGSREQEFARIREMIGLFVDKIWFILGVGLIFFVGALIFFYSQPNQYGASTRLMIKTPPYEVFLQTKEYKELMFVSPQSESFYNTQMTLIRSRQTMKKLVETMGLRAFGKEKELLSKNMDQLVYTLMSRISLNMVRGTQLMDVSVVLTDPLLAANVTNTLAEIYTQQYKTDTLAWAREFAGKLLREKQTRDSTEKTHQIFQSLLGSQGGSYIASLKAKAGNFSSQIDELSFNYKEQFPQMVHLKRKVDELNREIEIQTNKAIEDWLNSLDGQDLLSGPTIIEYAQVSTTPVGPKRWRGILLVTLAGLGGAYGLVFLLYQFDPRIKNEEELMQETGMVCLGIVPKLRRREQVDHYSKLPPDMKDTMAYIQTAIRFTMPKDHSKVILMTSALRAEGKTTMTANLAASFANDGLKTVLVDADTRRPRVHEIFHVSKSPGLTGYLKNGTALESILVDSGTPNLAVIPAGDEVSNPPTLLGCGKMNELIRRLRKEYDKVFIDTPPVLNIVDGMILSPLVDGVVLVINAEKTEKRVIKKIAEQFQQVGEKVIGGIINYYDTSKHSYYLNVYLRHEAEYYQFNNRISRKVRKLFKRTPSEPTLGS